MALVTQDHAAGLARGRRVGRVGVALLWAGFAWTVFFLVAGLLAVRIGWLADDDGATPAVVAGGIACLDLIAMFTMVLLGRRLVERHLPAVAEGTADDVPDHLQVGTARPRVQVVVMVAVLVAALVAMPFLGWPTGRGWMVPEGMGAAALVAFAISGPSALNLSSAYLAPTGIRLPLLGIRLPWESISQLRVSGAYRITIAIEGPAVPTGEQPHRWTRRAIARYRPGSALTVRAARPELAVWVSRQYLG